MRRQRLGLAAVVETNDAAVGIDQRRLDRFGAVDPQQQVDPEELLRAEDPDLLVARGQDRQRRRLHAAGGQGRPQPPAEQRRDRESHDPVEEPPRLPGMHQVVVDGARTLERGPDRRGSAAASCSLVNGFVGLAACRAERTGRNAHGVSATVSATRARPDSSTGCLRGRRGILRQGQARAPRASTTSHLRRGGPRR